MQATQVARAYVYVAVELAIAALLCPCICMQGRNAACTPPYAINMIYAPYSRTKRRLLPTHACFFMPYAYGPVYNNKASTVATCTRYIYAYLFHNASLSTRRSSLREVVGVGIEPIQQQDVFFLFFGL